MIRARSLFATALVFATVTCQHGGIDGPAPPPAAGASSIRWRLVHHETFDAPFREPDAWTEDTYGKESPWHTDAFGEDGAFFFERGGETFARGLRSFRSFRKAFLYGEHGWLTVELYGRDSDRDGTPETGGKLVSVGGKARLVSTRHYDAAILRSTDPLPPRYRVEVTVSNIRFGGKTSDKVNGYDGDETADPWRFDDKSPAPKRAVADNGVYFLCITDYPRPAPHNNVFIHHHRKVVMDTDNNDDGAGHAWSKVYDPRSGQGVEEGSHYVSMIFLRGDTFGSDWVGNPFLSYTPAGIEEGVTMVDQYLDGEAYAFSIERDGERYTLSARGRFRHGGVRTYRASLPMRGPPPVWHYNQTPAEHVPPAYDEVRVYGGESLHTWPAGWAYPDYFFFGDPHINYYEGTAEFDDLKLYVPEIVDAAAARDRGY
jgi:hypothetical protein